MKDIALDGPYLVPTDGSFRLKDARTGPPDGTSKKAAKEVSRKGSTKGSKDGAKKGAKPAADEGDAEQALGEVVQRIAKLQRKLYATDTWAVLLVFQAMDAAGKDGTIRAVMSGVDPSGCQVFSFKQPTHEDLDHDFLWRTTCRLPERGRIGIFNRSYYEEVLAVRVHPEYLTGQRLPDRPKKLSKLWAQRYQSIVEHERHLARSGVAIVKFWLNVSKEEQRQRFLARIDDESANWKFSELDVDERERWDEYMAAYEDALRETSKPWAPWYAVPADQKPYMRLTVARIIEATLERLDVGFPELPEAKKRRLAAVRRRLVAE